MESYGWGSRVSFFVESIGDCYISDFKGFTLITYGHGQKIWDPSRSSIAKASNRYVSAAIYTSLNDDIMPRNATFSPFTVPSGTARMGNGFDVVVAGNIRATNFIQQLCNDLDLKSREIRIWGYQARCAYLPQDFEDLAGLRYDGTNGPVSLSSGRRFLPTICGLKLDDLDWRRRFWRRGSPRTTLVESRKNEDGIRRGLTITIVGEAHLGTLSKQPLRLRPVEEGK